MLSDCYGGWNGEMTMDDRLQVLWVYLETQPLLWLTATLVVYQLAYSLWRRTRMTPLLNPVLVSILVLATMLKVTGVDYKHFFDGAQFIHFLLGPATVALAVPLYRQWARLRQSWPAVLAGLLCGSATAAGSALALAWGLGATRETILSLVPKSATTPIAIAVAEAGGGLPTLTAVAVILTGLVGAAFGVTVLGWVRVRHEVAIGVALGTASHGMGTARALAFSEAAGGFSGLAMGLNGLVTALLAPLLIWWLF